MTQMNQMNQLPLVPTVTISSLELVEVINELRPECDAKIRHDNFMAKIEKHPGIDSPKFLGQYKDSTGRTLKCYHLPKREAELMVMSESLEVQTRVYDRMTALEEQQRVGASAKQPEPTAAKALPPTKVFTDFFRVGRLIGMDKNAAAISANQATLKLTSTNVLQLLGHTHMEAERQAILFTPTELGTQFLGGMSGRKVNMLLADAGLQAKKGEHWVPLPAAEGFCRVMDTGKRHGDGTIILQVKWVDGVVALLNTAEAA